MNSPSKIRLAALALASSLGLGLTGCEEISNALSGDCETYRTQYDTEVEDKGLLAPSISDSAESFPMALVLNQRAVNTLFQQLAETAIPRLTESVNIPVLGEVSIVIAPEIPLLAIGGNADCPTCMAAAVPFGIGVGFNNDDPPLVAADMGVQMPLGMIPADNNKTSLTASFQQLTVTSLNIELEGQASSVVDTVEPIASDLLTAYLATRFENAEIATFDAWTIGNGEVLLAGRGPIVLPEQETIVIAMQSNLRTDESASLEVQGALPSGADIGVVFHPSLLLSMGQRMTYEGEIPREYDTEGESLAGGGQSLTLQSMSSADTGLLTTGARIFRTNNFCGTADLVADLGLSAGSDGFAFTVQNVDITGGEGSGSLLSNEWAQSTFLDALLNTLNVTVNYNQIFGGEAQSETEMGAFDFNIDGRGVTVFFNLVEGI